MLLDNPMLLYVVYRPQHANSTYVSQTPMHGDHNCHRLSDILPPQVEGMSEDIRHQLDSDAETLCPNSRTFLTTKTGFPKFKRNLQRRVIRQQQYLEVIRNCAVGLFDDYKQRVVADDNVALLPKHNHIVNPATVGSLANREHTSSCLAANESL